MTIALKVEVQGSLITETGAYEQKWETALDRAAAELTSMVQRTLKTKSNRYGMEPSTSGSPPNRGHSNLLRSIKWTNPGPFRRLIGSDLVYARIQELGGTIVSKKSMTIPVSLEAKKWLLSGNSAGQFPKPLFRIRSNQTGHMVLVESTKKKWTVHFLLTKSVRLPPRPYLRPTAQSPEFRDRLIAIFAGAGNIGVAYP